MRCVWIFSHSFIILILNDAFSETLNVKNQKSNKQHPGLEHNLFEVLKRFELGCLGFEALLVPTYE